VHCQKTWEEYDEPILNNNKGKKYRTGARYAQIKMKEENTVLPKEKVSNFFVVVRNIIS